MIDIKFINAYNFAQAYYDRHKSVSYLQRNNAEDAHQQVNRHTQENKTLICAEIKRAVKLDSNEIHHMHDSLRNEEYHTRLWSERSLQAQEILPKITKNVATFAYIWHHVLTDEDRYSPKHELDRILESYNVALMSCTKITYEFHANRKFETFADVPSEGDQFREMIMEAI